jgi:hypothetical protein
MSSTAGQHQLFPQPIDETSLIIYQFSRNGLACGGIIMSLRIRLYDEEVPRTEQVIDMGAVEGTLGLASQKREEVEKSGVPSPIAPAEILSQLIQRARHLIADPTNWYKICPEFQHQHCIETALFQSSQDSMLLPDETHGVIIACVNTAVRRLYPIYHPDFILRPSVFNDLALTTHDDVMLVMNVAAEIARQELGDFPLSITDFEGAEFGPVPSGSKDDIL